MSEEEKNSNQAKGNEMKINAQKMSMDERIDTGQILALRNPYRVMIKPTYKHRRQIIFFVPN